MSQYGTRLMAACPAVHSRNRVASDVALGPEDLDAKKEAQLLKRSETADAEGIMTALTKFQLGEEAKEKERELNAVQGSHSGPTQFEDDEVGNVCNACNARNVGTAGRHNSRMLRCAGCALQSYDDHHYRSSCCYLRHHHCGRHHHHVHGTRLPWETSDCH